MEILEDKRIEPDESRSPDARRRGSGTANEQTYFTTTNPNDPPITVLIPPENVLPPPKRKGGQKKPPPTAHLIIGFDTEYQSRDPIGPTKDEALDAKNEILSYQFCTKLVSKDPLVNGPQCSGIIIPEGNEQRWLLRDFVVAAIGTLIKEFPNVKVPTDIYLVGHFTRADLPMFHEFRGEAKRSLNNVRNTFVSIENFIPMTIEDRDGNEIESFRVRLRDTILLAPANAKKLADIGEMLGIEKIELHKDRAAERKIKENMKQFRGENWPLFRDYAIRDAEICTEYAERVIWQYDALFNQFKMPLTLTSFGSKLVIADWENHGWDPNEVLGKEERVQPRFSKRRGYTIKETITPYFEDVHFELDFVTETYHGGRNEQFLFGICDEHIWRDHDLSSAYTTAMSLIGKPVWEQMHRVESIEEIDMLDLAFVSVDFEFPESVRFPTLPVRSPNGIIFPRKGRSYCAAPEVVLAKQLGAQFGAMKRSIRVPVERDTGIFSRFITDCITERSAHKKGTFENLFWKEVGNSTYGKTAQGLRKKRVYDLRDDDMVELPESTLTQPFFASFITSYTRAVLGEILNRFPSNVQVFSVTTDGFLSHASDAEIAAATSGPLFQSFRQARSRLVQDDQPLEVKHTIRQPLGWRTRGSATLKLGDGNKANIVIQKGGIKSQFDLTDQEENARVVELFFNRTPGETQQYTSGIGLKDTIRYGSDFVYRSITKRLSMEFDWKRRPVDPQDRTVDFNGKAYTHLSFQSQPLESLEEFLGIRDAWQKWDRQPFRLLKSVPDLSSFLNYLETNRKSNPSSQTYMRKSEDADLLRLRRDLTRAFRRLQAGFDAVQARSGRIRHKALCEILIGVGIPCTVTDVDNARNDFIPYKTPATARVVSALHLLKQDHFPELDTDLFLDQQKLETNYSAISHPANP
ncbi:DNA polymerase [Mesorhizobium sp. M0239]|uniref:DNA polymerase n=1 Tax=Mesorhizobium sp. M0239 TaxID=2956924 RepID=UPI0033385011